jgi:UDPglucose 6-dehydrogenase
MNVTIFGSGYVGFISGGCLTEVGNHVVCKDIDQGKSILAAVKLVAQQYT